MPNMGHLGFTINSPKFENLDYLYSKYKSEGVWLENLNGFALP
jgi:hypothetical protein